jgi:D-glycero-D-manno-heptose 1,7-bisphosphate phosphatase
MHISQYGEIDLPNKDFLLILDRDDTLIKDQGRNNEPEKLEWLSSSIQKLKKTNLERVALCMATNQSGIGRGLFPFEKVSKFHDVMISQASKMGLDFLLLAVCPHAPSERGLPLCSCRKPNAGMLLELARNFPKIQNDRKCFIGNAETDRQAAVAAKFQYFDIESVDLCTKINRLVG